MQVESSLASLMEHPPSVEGAEMGASEFDEAGRAMTEARAEAEAQLAEGRRAGAETGEEREVTNNNGRRPEMAETGEERGGIPPDPASPTHGDGLDQSAQGDDVGMSAPTLPAPRAPPVATAGAMDDLKISPADVSDGLEKGEAGERAAAGQSAVEIFRPSPFRDRCDCAIVTSLLLIGWSLAFLGVSSCPSLTAPGKEDWVVCLEVSKHEAFCTHDALPADGIASCSQLTTDHYTALGEAPKCNDDASNTCCCDSDGSCSDGDDKWCCPHCPQHFGIVGWALGFAALMVVHLCEGCCNASVFRHIIGMKSAQQQNSFLPDLKAAPPQVEFCLEDSHVEESPGTGSDTGTSTVVTSRTVKTQLRFDAWTDTSNINIDLQAFPVTQLKLDMVFSYAATARAKRDELEGEFRRQFPQSDDKQEFKESKLIAGFQAKTLWTNSSARKRLWLMNGWVFWFCQLVFVLTVPYRMWFSAVTARVNGVICKHIQSISGKSRPDVT